MEWTTDNMDCAVQFRTDEDVLYSEFAHQGKGQGLFVPFTNVGETQDAFGGWNGWLAGKEVRLIHFAEIIWERLQAEAHKLQIDGGEKIPLYVTVSAILPLTVSMDMVLKAPIGTFSWSWLC